MHGRKAAGPSSSCVPASPGASTDFVARLSAEHISRHQGVTAVVENRAGANGMIGVDAVSRTAPDGNTLLVTANTYLLDDLLRKPNYSPVASFDPVCFLVQTPAVLVVNSESPYRTLADFVNAARAKPGELSLAAVGPGSTFQLGMIEFTRRAGINLTYVPYPGSAPAVTAIVGNHVTSAISGYAVVVEQIRAGRLRALAAATARRIEPQPDLPTFDKSGYKGLVMDNWFGVVAPAKTPKDTLAQLASWFTAAIEAPELKDQARGAISLHRWAMQRSIRRVHPPAPRRIRAPGRRSGAEERVTRASRVTRDLAHLKP